MKSIDEGVEVILYAEDVSAFEIYNTAMNLRNSKQYQQAFEVFDKAIFSLESLLKGASKDVYQQAAILGMLNKAYGFMAAETFGKSKSWGSYIRRKAEIQEWLDNNKLPITGVKYKQIPPGSEQKILEEISRKQAGK